VAAAAEEAAVGQNIVAHLRRISFARYLYLTRRALDFASPRLFTTMIAARTP